MWCVKGPPIELKHNSGTDRCSVSVHNLDLQKSKEKVWGGENKISAGGSGSIPRHTGGLVGSLAKGIGLSPDINEEASFDHVLQHWNVPNVGVDITDNQYGTLGLGLNLEQNGLKKLVRLPSIGRVLAATGVAV